MMENYSFGSINNERDERIVNNLKLVYWRCNKRFYNTKFSMEDIISIGVIGLIKASDSYDKVKGYSFTTYASKCIDNEILMTLRRYKDDKHANLEDAFLEDDLSYNDILQDDIDIEEDYLYNELIDNIKEIVNNLSEIDQRIYKLYFEYLVGQEGIAEMVGLSQSYVSRKIKRIVNTVEEELIRRELIDKRKIKKRQMGYNLKNVL